MSDLSTSELIAELRDLQPAVATVSKPKLFAESETSFVAQWAVPTETSTTISGYKVQLCDKE